MSCFPKSRLLGFAVLLLLGAVLNSCFGCSVLSHEAVIDAAWDVKLKSVLLSRYPKATPGELKEAHAFAYGGSIVQDLGYYPHSSREFSNLTHYVRTRDFVRALISESQDLNEFAFALGALSHYVADNDVHRFATIPIGTMLYPKLRRKFGDIVTYEKDPSAHLKTEFGLMFWKLPEAILLLRRTTILLDFRWSSRWSQEHSSGLTASRLEMYLRILIAAWNPIGGL